MQVLEHYPCTTYTAPISSGRGAAPMLLTLIKEPVWRHALLALTLLTQTLTGIIANVPTVLGHRWRFVILEPEGDGSMCSCDIPTSNPFKLDLHLLIS